jgi:hypothetical protein
MMKAGIFGAFVAVGMVAVGCSAPNAEEVAGSEGALHSATDCPAVIEVIIEKPTIMSNAKLLSSWERDFERDGESNPKQSAKDRLEETKNILATARSNDKVVLKGLVGDGCAYKTFDKATGQKSDWHIWLTYTGHELRLTQDVEQYHAVYTSVPITELTQTDLEVDSSRDSYVYAEDTRDGYYTDDPGGWRSWIGYAKVSARAVVSE